MLSEGANELFTKRLIVVYKSKHGCRTFWTLLIFLDIEVYRKTGDECQAINRNLFYSSNDRFLEILANSRWWRYFIANNFLNLYKIFRFRNLVPPFYWASDNEEIPVPSFLKLFYPLITFIIITQIAYERKFSVPPIKLTLPAQKIILNSLVTILTFLNSDCASNHSPFLMISSSCFPKE